MTSWGEMKTMKRNVLLVPHLCLYSQKISSRTLVILRTWVRNKVVFHWQRKNRRKMGSSRWWWSNSEKADTQFSEQRVRFLEERSKAKEVENYLYISVPMVIRMKLFFAQSFLIISSVSTEQSQQCDEYSIRAIRPIFRASTLTDNDTHILDWDSYTKKSIAEAQRTSGKIFPNQIIWSKKIVLMQDSWQQFKSDNTSWQNILTSS